jgi:hypothetical protein
MEERHIMNAAGGTSDEFNSGDCLSQKDQDGFFSAVTKDVDETNVQWDEQLEPCEKSGGDESVLRFVGLYSPQRKDQQPGSESESEHITNGGQKKDMPVHNLDGRDALEDDKKVEFSSSNNENKNGVKHIADRSSARILRLFCTAENFPASTLRASGALCGNMPATVTTANNSEDVSSVVAQKKFVLSTSPGNAIKQPAEGGGMTVELASDIECTVVEADSTEVDALSLPYAAESQGTGNTMVDNINTHHLDGESVPPGYQIIRRNTVLSNGQERSTVTPSNNELNPSMVPIKVIPAMKRIEFEPPSDSMPASYMPPDTTVMFQPEPGMLRSKPVPKPTRGRRLGRLNIMSMPMHVLNQGLYQEMQQEITKSQPLYHAPRQRYKLPEAQGLPLHPSPAFYPDMPSTTVPWSNYRVVHPDASGDMMGYSSDMGSLMTSSPVTPPLLMQETRRPWFVPGTSDLLPSLHDWSGKQDLV